MRPTTEHSESVTKSKPTQTQENKTPIFIISAEDPDCWDTNAWRSQELLEILEDKDIQHKTVTGCYKGIEERSFVLNTDRRTAQELAAYFDQESLLHVDARRRAYLIYQDTDFNKPGEFIGHYQSCSEAEAKAGDAWTYDPVSACYYRVINDQRRGR